MPKYKLTLTVDGTMLSTITDLLAGTGMLEKIEKIEEPLHVPFKGRIASRTMQSGIKRHRGDTSTEDTVLLVLDANSSQKYEIDMLEKIFEVEGFAKTSARSAANKLVRDGRIEKTIGPRGQTYYSSIKPRPQGYQSPAPSISRTSTPS